METIFYQVTGYGYKLPVSDRLWPIVTRKTASGRPSSHINSFKNSGAA